MSADARTGRSTGAWTPPPAEFPTLLDRYQVLGVLGEGGMGTVFKGFHLNLKRFVAIKTLRLDRDAEPDLVARFLRETEAVGRMDHPNVVRAADAGERNGVFYLIMEYLEGKDLSRLAEEHGPLGVADACELARQAALGLEHAHERGLVHRDVKPSNLMLTPAGVVKVLDLGLARLREAGAGEATPSGWAVGTYDYMAPEQASPGNPVDARADVYGLGCTLFRLLSGHAPFAGAEFDTPARKLYAHVHVPLSAAAGFAALPEALRPVLLRMTAKDPADRHGSARAAAEALAPFVGGARPAALLEGAGGAAPFVRPLPGPLPETLSRLTVPPEASTKVAPPARPPRTRRLRLAALLVGLSAVAGVAVLLAAFLRDRGGAAPSAADTGGPPPTAPAAEELLLPLPGAAPVAIDRLRPLEQHDLLGRGGPPPPLLGFRQGDGLSTARWMPGRQQLEINPVGTVLVPLGTTDRERPSFTLQALLDQRPWSGSVGLFWGYREDAAARRAAEAGREFARFQMLLLEQGRDRQGGVQFAVERATVTLQYTSEGRVSLLSRDDFARHELPNLANEQAVEIVVDGGRLKQARFGATDLRYLCTAAANKALRPEDYRGAFGLITLSANVTLRRPRVLPHADN